MSRTIALKALSYVWRLALLASWKLKSASKQWGSSFEDETSTLWHPGGLCLVRGQ